MSEATKTGDAVAKFSVGFGVLAILLAISAVLLNQDSQLIVSIVLALIGLVLINFAYFSGCSNKKLLWTGYFLNLIFLLAVVSLYIYILKVEADDFSRGDV